VVFHFPAMPSRLLRLQARIDGLHSKLTRHGAAELKRPVFRGATTARALSPASEFNSANLAHLQAELDCLERRAGSAAPLPAEIRRSLDKLREQVEWLVGLRPPA
jgi:hypothetical protein